MASKRNPSLKTDKRGGRQMATFGLLLGFAVSVTANILDEFVVHSTPEWGALFLGFFWPFTLLFSTEVMARNEWPSHWMWIVARVAGLAPVAGVAAWMSYWHLQNLMLHYGADHFSSHIAPLGIDGFMLMMSVALMAPAAVAKRATKAPAVVAVSTPAPVAAPAAPAGAPDISELIPHGEAVLALMREEGIKPSKTALGKALRERDIPISKARAAALYDALV